MTRSPQLGTEKVHGRCYSHLYKDPRWGSLSVLDCENHYLWENRQLVGVTSTAAKKARKRCPSLILQERAELRLCSQGRHGKDGVLVLVLQDEEVRGTAIILCFVQINDIFHCRWVEGEGELGAPADIGLRHRPLLLLFVVRIITVVVILEKNEIKLSSMCKTRQGQEQQQSANTERLSGRIWVKHGKKGDSEIPNYIVVKLWKEMKKFNKINIKKVIS